MNDLTLSLIAAGCIVAGVLVGMGLQNLLPTHHLSDKSRATVTLGAGMIATMSALVLGLLVSSAKNSYDIASADVAQTGAKIIALDELLTEYGPETKPLRERLKTTLAERIDAIWGRQTNSPSGLRAIEASKITSVMQKKLSELVPVNEEQKVLLAELVQISRDIRQNRVLLIEQQQLGLPPVFLGLLVFWLTLLFVSFGLFAPRNATVISVLLVCALSVSSAIFLVLEMNHPLEGIIQVPSAPLRKALELIGH